MEGAQNTGEGMEGWREQVRKGEKGRGGERGREG